MKAVFAAIGFALLLFVAPAFAAEELPPVMKDVGLAPKLGSQIPIDEEFLDESGKTVSLFQFFDGHTPVVLIFNYYTCPILCSTLLEGARGSFQNLGWKPGDHYKVVTISIDPRDDAGAALAKRRSILSGMKDPVFRAGAEKNWHFLVGKKGSEARLAEALGFKYKWIAEEKQFAHGAALFFASPSGRLSRVMQGIDFPALDLKLAILEAGEGKVGTFAEKLLLFCYHLEPKDNKPVLLASRLVSIGGAVTVAVILLGYLVLFLRNRRKGNACSLSP